MRVRNFAFSILAALLFVDASPAMAGKAQTAGPVWAGVDHSVLCKIYNTTSKSYDVTIDMVGAETNSVLQTSGVVTLAPGGYTAIFQSGVSAQVLCRFTGPSSKKSAAVLSMYHSTLSDGSDSVVVPAR